VLAATGKWAGRRFIFGCQVKVGRPAVYQRRSWSVRDLPCQLIVSGFVR